jgi:hypothetical protein
VALSVSVSVDPDTLAVAVDVSGGTPPYAARAYPTGGSSYPLLGEWIGTGSDLSIYDGRARIGVPTTYTVEDDAAAEVTSAEVTVGGGAVLTSALDPYTAVPVVVQRDHENEREARGVIYDVIERESPAVAIAPMRFPSGDLVLRVPQEDRAALDDLIRSGEPLSLRTPHPESSDDKTFMVLRFAQRAALDDLPKGYREVTLSYQVIEDDLGPFYTGADNTWTAVQGAHATWTDVLVTYATWADVRRNRPRT